MVELISNILSSVSNIIPIALLLISVYGITKPGGLRQLVFWIGFTIVSFVILLIFFWEFMKGITSVSIFLLIISIPLGYIVLWDLGLILYSYFKNKKINKKVNQ